MANTINYRDTQFERANLTPIRGEPTFESIHKLRNEIKTNARSVYSDLSGGMHGHLGLVLTADQYALASLTVFNHPAHPDLLVITAGSTVAQTTTQKEEHVEARRVLREVMGVKQALVQQIVATIDPAYLTDVRNRTTNSIDISVSDLLEHHQDAYGKLMPHELQEREDTAKSTTYNPRNPIAGVLGIVKDLLEFAEMAGTPMSEPQAVNIGYVILHKTAKFAQALVEWNQKALADKTWLTFKKHFHTAHKELRATTDLTAQDAGMHHTNMVRDVVAGLQEALSPPTDPNMVSAVPTRAPSPPAAVDTQVANAITLANTNQQQLLQQMQTMMQTMQMQMDSGARGQNGGRNTNSNNNNQTSLAQYCWTHGLCAHTGTICRTPADGHQATATQTNCMGGSDRNH